MKTTIKKIQCAGKNLGVNVRIDKALDKFSKIVPDKVKENQKILSNAKFNF